MFHTCRAIELSKLLFVANWTDAVRRQPKPEDINVLLWRIITGDSTFNHIHRIRCTRDSINMSQTFQAQYTRSMALRVVEVVGSSLQASHPMPYLESQAWVSCPIIAVTHLLRLFILTSSRSGSDLCVSNPDMLASKIRI